MKVEKGSPFTYFGSIVTSEELKVTARYVHSDVRGKMCAYRASRRTVSTNQHGESNSHTTETEGLAFLDDLEKYAASGAPIPSPNFWDPSTGHAQIIAVKMEFRNILRMEGWYGDAINDEKMIVRQPLTALENDEEFEVIKLLPDNHQAVDLDGTHIPVCVRFDYIGGNIDNKHYDLKRLVQILGDRDDVTIELKHGRAVQPIEYYNADEERHHYVAFLWHPRQDDYERVMSISVRRRSFSGIAKVVFDLDMFGLRRGGASKFKDFYGVESVAPTSSEK